MKKSKIANLLLASSMVLTLGVALAPTRPAAASSHREAPLISQDPTADVTDLYAFVSPDMTNTVTLMANWIPLEQPQGGPNFYEFDYDVVYDINIDTDGDGTANTAYQWVFDTRVQNPDTFLYNTGPITSLTDSDYNRRQYYTLTKVTFDSNKPANGDMPAIVNNQVLVDNAIVPPVNIGPRSTPNYDALASAAVVNTSEGGRSFVGQRDDPFFVDLGSIFDLAGLRPLNQYHAIPLPAAPGVDGVSGYNVHTTAVQVPISALGATNNVIGVWASSYRARTRIFGGGRIRESGPLVQVSRLGNPLVNEVLIPMGQKDYWNSTKPKSDSRFDEYILHPEPAGLENLLYPVLTDTQTSNRQDLLAVFHTGIPGLNQLPTQRHADELRLNVSIPPSANPNRLGVLAGQLDGFPNGRRLGDDVTDIELQAVACAYGAVGDLVYSLTGNCNPAIYNGFPNNAVGDGVNANDKPFLAHFPYAASPWQGYEAMPPTTPNDASKAAIGLSGAAAGLGLLFVYRRRRTRKETAQVS